MKILIDHTVLIYPMGQHISLKCCQVGDFIAKFDQSWLNWTPFGKIYFQIFSVFGKF